MWLRATTADRPCATTRSLTWYSSAQARVDVPRVDHQAAQGEPGVQLDVVGAHHARVLDGPLGGGDRLGAGIVQHRPVGGHGEHLGVHLGGRQAADQFLGDAQLAPAVAAALCLDQQRALCPEPGGALRVPAARTRPGPRFLLLLQQAQRPLGDLHGALTLPAQPPGDGGLGHQVQVAQGLGGRVAACRAGRPRCSRLGAGPRVRRRAPSPTVPSRARGAGVAPE